MNGLEWKILSKINFTGWNEILDADSGRYRAKCFCES